VAGCERKSRIRLCHRKLRRSARPLSSGENIKVQVEERAKLNERDIRQRAMMSSDELIAKRLSELRDQEYDSVKNWIAELRFPDHIGC
jgi:hypothetical protein